MRKILYPTLLPVLLMLVISCDKDHLKHCPNYPSDEELYGRKRCMAPECIEKIEPTYILPFAFNPANPDELLLLERNQDESQIVKGAFPALTITDTLPKLNFWTYPQWSPDGEWLLFDYAKVLFKARPDGSQLTRLTFGMDAYHDPIWISDGTEILAWRRTPENRKFVTVLSASGQVLREQEEIVIGGSLALPYYAHGSYYPDGIVFSPGFKPTRQTDDVTGRSSDISVLDVETLQEIRVIHPKGLPDSLYNLTIASLYWIPGTNKILWNNGSGVYLTDIETEETKILWQTNPCKEFYFTQVLPAPDGQSMLVNMVFQTYNFDEHLFYKDIQVHQISMDGEHLRQLW